MPALLEWPNRFKAQEKVHVPLTTSDYYLTICSILGVQYPDQPYPLDGIDFMPLIQQGQSQRLQPIAFKALNQRAYNDNQYKIYSSDDGKSYEMYDLFNDPYETQDIAEIKPELLRSMIKELEIWANSCQVSEKDGDYAK